MKKVSMGDRVFDRVSGFTGIVASKHDYLSGCTRFTVQPKVDSEGKLPDSQTFDELQLSVIETSVVEEGSKLTGGPSKFEDEGRR